MMRQSAGGVPRHVARCARFTPVALAAAAALAFGAVVGQASCGTQGTGAATPGIPAAPTDPGTGGPTLPGALQSGCFGWPGTEFSPANKATVATFLAPGQQAIDFSLRDTTGTQVRLSDLLRTRSVLLVHGSFT